jgi:Ca2+-transporting ATPase
LEPLPGAGAPELPNTAIADPAPASPKSRRRSEATAMPSQLELTAEFLSELVNFDKRTESGQVDRLREFGGSDGIARKLRTDPVRGLAVDSTAPKPILAVRDREDRQALYGINVVPPPESETIFEMVWNTIKEDPIIKILLLGALITLIIGTSLHPEEGWIDGLAIMIAVVIVLTVTGMKVKLVTIFFIFHHVLISPVLY